MSIQKTKTRQCTLDNSPYRHSKNSPGLRIKTKSKQPSATKGSSYIQDNSRHNLIIAASPVPNQATASLHHKFAMSQHRRPQKQNMNSEHFQENNIFREPSTNFSIKSKRQDLRLPTLTRNKTNIFQMDSLNPQSHQKRPKVIRIPLQKLIALNSDEVKRRFMLKYNLSPLDNPKQ